MNTAPVTYRPVENPTPEPAAPAAPSQWTVIPISRNPRYTWHNGQTKRSALTPFLKGMAALMEFPGLFPKRK